MSFFKKFAEKLDLNNTKSDEVGKIPSIAVIGLGGAGCNITTWIAEHGLSGGKIIGANTDENHLNKFSKADKLIILGKKICKGHGCEGNPELGAMATKENLGEIKAEIEGTNIVFLVAGLGGGMGTGSMPIVAEIAKSLGAFTIACVCIPFQIEQFRREKAREAIQILSESCDSTIVIDNSKVREVAGNLPLKEALAVTNALVGNFVKTITETITQPSLINLDYTDLREVMERGGVSSIGIGEADGEYRVINAVKQALAVPLLDSPDLSSVKSVLVHIFGCRDMTLKEVATTRELIMDMLPNIKKVILGAKIDRQLIGRVRTMVVLNGVGIKFEENIGYMRAEKELIEPESVSDSESSTEELVKEGNELCGLGKHNEAIKCYDKAIKINPEDAYAWNNKGIALNELRNYDEAIECYDKILEINPEDANAWNNKGLPLGNLGKHDEAIKCYDKAIKINPEDAYAWNNKGIALNELENYEEAIECYNKALEIDPEDETVSKNIEIAMQKLEEPKKGKIKISSDASISKDNIMPSENKGDIEINKPREIINKTIIEPTSIKVTQEDINITSAFGYKGATIVYKVKIENNTNEPISDIKIYPYVPTVFLLKEKERSITLIQPKSSQTVTFEIRPTGECGDCNVSGRINYYDMISKKYLDIELKPKSLSIVCPMLRRKEITEDAWRDLVSGLVKAEETTTDVPVDGEGLFGLISEILKDLNLFMLPPVINKAPQIFRGTARFYGEGVKGLRYAAQIEVVGGARKSKLILKAWAEKEDALTGFYHGVLDEIEKRVKVKEYIDDSIVQYNIQIGDKIGTLVKDSVIQRSSIGASTRKCPNCSREVDANEKFCLECGAKL